MGCAHGRFSQAKGRYQLMLEMVLANSEDLMRLAWLEHEGHFKPGFAVASLHQVQRYMLRIFWLSMRRHIPGAPPYPGPRVY